MSINHEEINRIQKLSSAERIAGYLFYSAKLAMHGAKIRKDNRPDESWSKEEEKEWYNICDELEPWWYSLSEEEHAILEDIEVLMAKLTCAESLII